MSALASWWAALPALGVAVLLLLAPGWALARAWGVRGWPAAAVAIPLSLGVVGVAEILLAGIGLPWLPWGWAAIATLTCLAAAPRAAVLLTAGRTATGPGAGAGEDAIGRSTGRPPLLHGPLALAVACAVLVLATTTVIGTGGPDSPAQAFDAVFHLAAVDAVRRGGSASSLGGLAALYQGAPVYYPSVWHGIVALLPAAPVVASNVMVMAVGALAWPVGVVGMLVGALAGPPVPCDDGGPVVRDDAGSRQTAAALVTGLSAATVGVPAILLTSLAAWPYALSVVCLPGVLVIAARVRDRLLAGAAAGRDLALLVGAVAGTVLAHGAGLFNAVVLLVPFALSCLTVLVRRGGRARVLSLVGIGALLVMGAAGAWLMRAPLGGVLGYQRDGGSAIGTLIQALVDLPQYGPLASHGLPVGVATLALAALGTWRGRRTPTRPWAVAAALALALVVLVGGPQWPGRQIGSFWYLQKSRIEPLVIIPALVLAAHGLLVLLGARGRGGAEGARRPTARGIGGAAAVVAIIVMGRAPLQMALVRSVHDAGAIAYGTLTTPEELEVYARLGRELPEGAVVVGAPSLGVSYLGIVGGVDVVYPTRVEPLAGTPELALAKVGPGEAAGGGACPLLDGLGARYYVQVERDGSGFRYGNAPLRWDEAIASWSTTGMEEVDSATTSTGAVTLWRMTACDR